MLGRHVWRLPSASYPFRSHLLHCCEEERASMSIRHLCCACFALAVWSVVFSAEAQAVALSALFQGATITADDKLFNNFTLINSLPVNGGFADPTQIDVTPLVDDPLDPGIKFTAQVSALGTPSGHTGPSSIQFTFSFDVSTTNQLPLIKDNSLLISQWSFDSGPLASIQVSEQVFDASNVLLGTKLASVSPQTQNLSDSLQFTPRPFVHVIKQINIVGPGDNDMARLRMFEQRFSQVPEPHSCILFAATSLICFLGRGIRRRSASVH
jgi:hypothetical protein